MPGRLFHSPADIVRRVLIARGLGADPNPDPTVTVSWPIYVANEPSVPDNCITIYTTAGTNSGRTNPDGERQGHHGIQVRVRAKNDRVGINKANEIAIGMDAVDQHFITLDTTNYVVHSLNRSSDVLPIGKDPNSNRPLYTINALTVIRVDPTVSRSEVRSPSAAASEDPGDINWTSLTNIFASDSSTAITQISASAGTPVTSKTLKATGYGFSIPSYATILGIEVRVERRSAANIAGVHFNDHTVQLRKSSGAIGDNKANATDWTTTMEIKTYGGPTDLWGTTWTPSEINNSEFGAHLRTQLTVDSGSVINQQFRVDHIPITVYYES